MNKISIIIPMLNESESIMTLIDHLIKNSSIENISDIIIVDGGSQDGSQEQVLSFNEAILLHSDKGRAKQMNLGAENATGNVFYFLHADSFPPKDFDQHIISEIAKGNNAGCFRMKFESKHPVLLFSQWFTRFNYKLFRGGDQSLFVTKEIFNDLNGYNEIFEIYEDCDFINKLYHHYNFTIISEYITTSARRYLKNGTWRLQFHYGIIHLKKWFGASAEELNRYFKKNIA